MRLQKLGSLSLLLLFFSTVADAKIVFSSTRDGVEGIYVIDDDGSNETALTFDGDPFPAEWSPDGQQILFQRHIRETFKDDRGIWTSKDGDVLFIMNADGTNIRQLTENNGSDINGGSFSPDGTSIIFNESIQIDKKWHSGIYELNIETGKRKEIVDIDGIQGRWSPDGKQIVFAMPEGIGNGFNATIWIMDADGHNPRPLLPGPGVGEFTTYRYIPRWSPDSKHILFQEKTYKWVHIPNVANVRVYKEFRYIICDRNGENIRKLRIPKDWEGSGIDYMDDGKSIVFGAYVGIPLNKPLPRGFRYPPCNLYKYHIWTGEITQLTDYQGVDQGVDDTVDWISDAVLSVTPKGKKLLSWGELKK